MTEINPENGTRNWQQLFVIENGVPVFADNAPLTRWLAGNGQRPSDEWLASQGYYGLEVTDPPVVDPEEGYVEEADMRFWRINEETKTISKEWQIIYYTEEDKSERLAQAWRNMRAERDNRLRLCDWTQVADSPMFGNAEWLKYRQALRDLPSVTVNPREPQWPIAP